MLNHFSLNNLVALSARIRSESLALEEYLEHLETMFAEREPEILAFVPEEGRFERLRREAAALRQQYPEPSSRPQLFGIPIGVKDIFHVEGFTTQAGTKVPAEVLQGKEAISVTRLKEAGALILGKTVTTEFAYFGPGPTRNPYDLEHTPGGSSSGSAAAVSAGLAPLTLGTQTIGSVNRPAAYCGVVGFKPSYGRVPTTGIIPLSASLDHVGLFTHTVAGSELGASILIPEWHLVIDKHRPVLGIPDGPYLTHTSSEGLVHFWATIDKLEHAGYTIKLVPAMTDFEAIAARHVLIVDGEIAQHHAQWYGQFAHMYQEKTKEHIERGRTITVGQLADALQGRFKLRAELTHLMDEYGLDLWLSPSAPGPAPLGLESTGNPVMNLPWTHAGLPTLTIPSGFHDGLPLGLQLCGRWYTDEALLEWSEEIEQIVTPW
jgi:Asp-tRNA(Asn)/Glu-tRNA(Gln) amidotransferase A subunit family amidase